MTTAAAGPITLDDRYLREKGLVYLTGVQALVRLVLDQNRRDRRAGLRIGTFVSGYPGSPLGGYDAALARIPEIARQHDVVHVPAANEELAATAIMGTQMLDRHPHSRWDGVTAVWYGKGPGVDRSGDAFKHGNFAGTSRHGAVVVLAAEDHEGKSSTMPFQDDYAFMASGIPILYPASVGEFLTLGLHAVALSRFSGCWIAIKCVGALCDGGEIIEVAPEMPAIVAPELAIGGRPFEKKTDFTFFPGKNIEFERHLYQERHLAVVAYVRANGLDRVEVRTARDRVGIVTAGKSYADTRQALADLGLGHEDLRRAGIRLLRVGAIYPADHRLIREFAQGLEEVVVVEEKRGFLESQVKEAVCGVGRPLRVVGKLDEDERPLFPLHGGLDSDVIAERLAPRLSPYLDEHGRARARRRLDEIGAVRGRAYAVHAGRTPNYCSGCPHNTSTVLLPDQVAWGSPGCHSFATLIEQPRRHIEAMTQYGGEGLPWVGLAPFTDRAHMVQNVGDGSLFHSSYLNIRFCAAVKANITFKILYNGAIANTGAQLPVGARPVPALTRLLSDEGVTRIALVTKRPGAYRRRELGAVTRVYPAAGHDQAMRDLREERGVTVLIYDETCANERRRRQKRGTEAAPNRFVVINEDVCEACGHCGELTNCMSLERVETEFGEKTRVHASTCNQDDACLKGDCPSFLTVETREGTGYARPRPERLEADAVPEPERRAAPDRPYHIYTPGVGGTGVITVNALLGWAALLDGKRVLSYDQTGAAQKWGPVLSSLVVMPDPDQVAANKVGLGRADLYLALDPLAAATPVNLDRCAPDRTGLLCVTSVMPTGEMVRTGNYGVPIGAIRESIARHCRPDRTVFADARWAAEGLFRDHMMVNMLAVGVAYQAGLLPVSADSVEAAVRLNGVAVDDNLQAFRYGRLYCHDPLRVEALVRAGEPRPEQLVAAAVAALAPEDAREWESLRATCRDLDEESRRLVALRSAELIGYQDAAYASAYVAFVREVAARERALGGARADITHAVARYLYKLMAYKDEYEVARLHRKPAMAARIADLFGQPQRVRYHLHPPLLRAFGLERKLALGPWFSRVLGLLVRLRGLRGTPWDPFGRDAVRREERALPGWYREVMTRALARLDPESYDAILALAKVPDQVRGYEAIKLRSVAAARERAADLLRQVEPRAVSPGES